jgi:hypothetical protein
MKNRPSHITNAYKQNSMLKKLAKHSQLLSKLNHLLQQSLPPHFAAQCQLANVKSDTIVIQTNNPSLASLLRFQSATLCKTLNEQTGYSLTKVEVKVNPNHSPFHVNHSNTLTLSNSAAETISLTAAVIEEGPLKTALEKLARRHH